MKKIPAAPGSSDKAVAALLERHKCPTPFYAARTIFLGHIASPKIDFSPIDALKSLWGGTLPEFDSEVDVQALFAALLNGFWNRIAEHQNSRNPFRLTRPPLAPVRAELGEFCQMRQRELAGFLDGMFGRQGSLLLPEKAHKAVQTLADLQSLFMSSAQLFADETKPAPHQELVKFISHAQRLTIIAEAEINAAIQSCKRARAHHIEALFPTQRSHASVEEHVHEEGEPTLIESPLSQRISRNGVTVDVQIYADEHGKWILEIVDQANSSHVWDDPFDSDHDAMAEAMRALDEEPMEFAGGPAPSPNFH
jgi:hypothetical protein